LLSCMYPEGAQWKQGSPHTSDATICGAKLQHVQDAQDAKSRLGKSGPNPNKSDAGYLFADGVRAK